MIGPVATQLPICLDGAANAAGRRRDMSRDAGDTRHVSDRDIRNGGRLAHRDFARARSDDRDGTWVALGTGAP